MQKSSQSSLNNQILRNKKKTKKKNQESSQESEKEIEIVQSVNSSVSKTNLNSGEFIGNFDYLNNNNNFQRANPLSNNMLVNNNHYSHKISSETEEEDVIIVEDDSQNQIKQDNSNTLKNLNSILTSDQQNQNQTNNVNQQQEFSTVCQNIYNSLMSYDVNLDLSKTKNKESDNLKNIINQRDDNSIISNINNFKDKINSTNAKFFNNHKVSNEFLVNNIVNSKISYNDKNLELNKNLTEDKTENENNNNVKLNKYDEKYIKRTEVLKNIQKNNKLSSNNNNTKKIYDDSIKNNSIKNNSVKKYESVNDIISMFKICKSYSKIKSITILKINIKNHFNFNQIQLDLFNNFNASISLEKQRNKNLKMNLKFPLNDEIYNRQQGNKAIKDQLLEKSIHIPNIVFKSKGNLDNIYNLKNEQININSYQILELQYLTLRMNQVQKDFKIPFFENFIENIDSKNQGSNYIQILIGYITSKFHDLWNQKSLRKILKEESDDTLDHFITKLTKLEKRGNNTFIDLTYIMCFINSNEFEQFAKEFQLHSCSILNFDNLRDKQSFSDIEFEHQIVILQYLIGYLLEKDADFEDDQLELQPQDDESEDETMKEELEDDVSNKGDEKEMNYVDSPKSSKNKENVDAEIVKEGELDIIRKDVNENEEKNDKETNDKNNFDEINIDNNHVEKIDEKSIEQESNFNIDNFKEQITGNHIIGMDRFNRIQTFIPLSKRFVLVKQEQFKAQFQAENEIVKITETFSQNLKSENSLLRNIAQIKKLYEVENLIDQLIFFKIEHNYDMQQQFNLNNIKNKIIDLERLLFQDYSYQLKFIQSNKKIQKITLQNNIDERHKLLFNISHSFDIYNIKDIFYTFMNRLVQVNRLIDKIRKIKGKNGEIILKQQLNNDLQTDNEIFKSYQEIQFLIEFQIQKVVEIHKKLIEQKISNPIKKESDEALKNFSDDNSLCLMNYWEFDSIDISNYEIKLPVSIKLNKKISEAIFLETQSDDEYDEIPAKTMTKSNNQKSKSKKYTESIDDDISKITRIGGIKTTIELNNSNKKRNNQNTRKNKKKKKEYNSDEDHVEMDSDADSVDSKEFIKPAQFSWSKGSKITKKKSEKNPPNDHEFANTFDMSLKRKRKKKEEVINEECNLNQLDNYQDISGLRYKQKPQKIDNYVVNQNDNVDLEHISKSDQLNIQD